MTRAICIGSRVGIASAAQTAKAAGADAMLISQEAAAFGLVTFGFQAACERARELATLRRCDQIVLLPGD